MRMGYGLNVIQTQKLIMTPELRQAITILQLSALELESYVEQQLEENPLLEVRDEEIERSVTGDKIAAEDKPEDNGYDIDWQDYFHDSSDLGLPRSEIQADPNWYGYEHFASRTPTLIDHLLLQLGLSKCTGKQKMIAEYIIGNINHNGYLFDQADNIANQLNLTEDEVKEALTLVQSFDPPGVGARSLRECLLLQLKYLNISDPLAFKIVEQYLPALADGKYNRMAQHLNVSVQEIQRAADLLKTLDPKPGRNFSGAGDNRYIIPDIALNKVDNEYVIIINDVYVPRLSINNTYRAVLNQDKGDHKTKEYVEHKLNAAAWLIRSIEQRRLTLYKVTKCLVDLQRDFLDYGVKYLKPLNLKTVADMVGLHESTVSRATSNKYIQTPRGVLEMKYFFSSGLTGEGGAAVSAESVKKSIQEIVTGEDPKEPLNDQQIADIFARRNVKISRRTVAKYRDELRIPPIRKRKRY